MTLGSGNHLLSHCGLLGPLPVDVAALSLPTDRPTIGYMVTRNLGQCDSLFTLRGRLGLLEQFPQFQSQWTVVVSTIFML